MEHINTLDYSIFSGKVHEVRLPYNLQVINTLNAYSFVAAETNPAFKKALQKSDILLPDGFPIVVAVKLLKRKKIQKIAGADLFFHYMDLLNKTKGRVFFVGSSESTLSMIRKNAKEDFPNVRIETYSPPFTSEISTKDSSRILSAINQFKPDVVFVGMTAPKQELWVDEHKHKINARAVCSIGAVFDFYAGKVKRAPAWMIFFNLEWLYRLIKEPGRLWKRYLIISPLFLLYVFFYLVNHRYVTRKVEVQHRNLESFPEMELKYQTF
jgi:N-acetylglucosaminyldiphosphoundecaprenol N-acetyl-beta-D-mannosaminyltransferase